MVHLKPIMEHRLERLNCLMDSPHGAWKLMSMSRMRFVVQKLLDEDGNGPQIKQAKTPFPSSYKPELDVTEELDDAMISRFQQLIGILRWAMELGCMDVCLKLSVLSQHFASPRQGHLENAHHLFACLKAYPQVKSVFDLTEPCIDES